MQNQFSKKVTTRQPKTIDQYPSLQLSQMLRNGYWNNRWMVRSVDESNPISENQFEFIHRFSKTDALLNSITKKLIWTKACVYLESMCNRERVYNMKKHCISLSFKTIKPTLKLLST